VNRGGVFTDPARHFKQDAMDLGLFLVGAGGPDRCFCSMVSMGSTNTVCPLELLPCTTPGTRRFAQS